MPETKTKQATATADAAAWENPLIPNKRLRAMYVAMVELRLLGQHVASLRRSRTGGATAHPGEEGCRVSTTFDIKPGDLTSDATDGLATSFLRGEELAEVIHRAHAAASRKPHGGVAAPGALPAMEKSVDRLHLAMGAALVLKSARKSALLIAYVRSDDATTAEWKPLWRLAAEQALPVLFVVLPGAGTKLRTKPGQLSLASSRCGVPGIPVDVADPVALYRVAQEAMLRTRAGGGPVLMECIAFKPAGRKIAPADAIATMQDFLLHRKLVDKAWLEGVERRFRRRLNVVER